MALVDARDRDSQLTKPPGALGRLEEIAFWLAAWTGRAPAVTRPLVAIFAGNHGVDAQGVTPFPPEGDPADGGEFRGWRRGDQPDLRSL